jgi:hypothetical protein
LYCRLQIQQTRELWGEILEKLVREMHCVPFGELLADCGGLPHLLGCHGNLNLGCYGPEVSAGMVVTLWMRLELLPPLLVFDLQLLEK